MISIKKFSIILIIVVFSLNKIEAISFENQLITTYDNNNIVINNNNLILSEYSLENQNNPIKFEMINNLSVKDILNKNWDINNMALGPYRFTVTYKNKLNEYRLGLQQLSFGAAKYIRPLQWFDSINPLDNDTLNEGVYGLLYRKYNKQNHTTWFWVLYGNELLRITDLYRTVDNGVEVGGRYQLPIAFGEIGLSIHRREIKFNLSEATENRLGFDFISKGLIPLWTEHVIVIAESDSENQQILRSMLGTDYTLGIGNGLYLLTEWSYSNILINSETSSLIGGVVQLNYPISVLDQVSYIAQVSDQGQAEHIWVYSRTFDFFKAVTMLYTKNKKASIAFYWNY